MPPDSVAARPTSSQQGWQGFTNVLGRHIPYQLTQGGNARKALYALMYPRKR